MEREGEEEGGKKLASENSTLVIDDVTIRSSCSKFDLRLSTIFYTTAFLAGITRTWPTSILSLVILKTHSKKL